MNILSWWQFFSMWIFSKMGHCFRSIFFSVPGRF